MNRRRLISSVGAGSAAFLAGCISIGESSQDPIEAIEIRRRSVDVEPTIPREKGFSDPTADQEDIIEVDLTVTRPVVVHLQQPVSQGEFNSRAVGSPDGEWNNIALAPTYKNVLLNDIDYPQTFEMIRAMDVGSDETDTRIFRSTEQTNSGSFDAVGFRPDDRFRLAWQNPDRNEPGVERETELTVLKRFQY